ncbi:MAG TPA: hypothetical protein VF832_08460 [Longimicrobiales bacterium]
MAEQCRYYRIGRAPMAGAFERGIGFVPIETCDLGALVVGVDREAGVWLAYGPDEALVCRESCTEERLAAMCRAAHRRASGNDPACGAA